MPSEAGGSAGMAPTLARVEDEVRAYAASVPAGAYTRDTTLRSSYNHLYRLQLRHALGEPLEGACPSWEAVRKQQLEDGFLAVEEHLAAGGHDQRYARLHKSGLFFQFAYAHDLDVRLPALERLVSERELRDYLVGLDYSNIWYHSNVLLGIASASHFRALRGHPDPYREIIAEHLLSGSADRQGLWGRERGASLLNAVAGAFHLVPILESLDLAPPHGDALAAEILRMQTPSGLFCGPGGYSCIEYDCAYLLWAVTRTGTGDEAIRRSTREAMRRLFNGLVRIQNDDGGFPEIGRPRYLWSALRDVVIPVLAHRDAGTLVWNLKKLVRIYAFRSRPIFNNSATECAAGVFESNLFSSWFRLLTLRLAADALGSVPLDPEATMRVVGLNYWSEGARVGASSRMGVR